MTDAREVEPPRPTRAEALAKVEDPKEVRSTPVYNGGSEPPTNIGGEDFGGKTFSAFLGFHPFTTFFCWLAHRQYSHQSPEARVAKHRKESPKLYATCTFLDMLVTGIAALGLMATATAVVYKSVWL